MKKIIITRMLFGISFFASNLFAQEISSEKLKIFQTDNVENFKKSFKKEDLSKCYQIKDTSYDLLSLAVKHNRTNIFNYLITNGADVNKSCSDVTPLMYAATFGYVDTAKILLKNGAKKTTKDNNGKTAKDYAIENKHEGISVIF